MSISNRFEISYIIKQQLSEHKSRFQIDVELISRGYTPESIDKVWHSLAHPKNNKVTWREKYANRQTLIILNIIGLSIAVTLIFSNPFPVSPFPLYPAAKPLNISKDAFIKYWGMTYWGDNGRYGISLSDSATQIQVLETTDPVDAICKFYDQTAQQANLTTMSAQCDPYSFNVSYYIFRTIYVRSQYSYSQYGIGLQIFVKNDQYEQSLIADLVKNPTAATKIILVVNGYFQYDNYD